MKKMQLAVLLGFLHNQKQITTKILEDIEATEADRNERKSHPGYLLHNLYCALEDLWQEVARTFENRLEDPARTTGNFYRGCTWRFPASALGYSLPPVIIS